MIHQYKVELQERIKIKRERERERENNHFLKREYEREL